ncbi:ATP-binding protein [Streptomyces sp. NPDC002730]|uniref:ATP-binding protein n=1 Tax=Streptomyces sp. NPDC002730 TaxID=3364662 RepID=UPI0036BA41D4
MSQRERAHLRLWKLDCLADCAAILISELVTNAFCHGRGESVALRMIRHRSDVRIEIYDGSSGRPHECAARPDDESGRGLAIVAAIADAWGVSEDGTSIWCSLAVPTAGSER